MALLKSSRLYGEDLKKHMDLERPSVCHVSFSSFLLLKVSLTLSRQIHCTFCRLKQSHKHSSCCRFTATRFSDYPKCFSFIHKEMKHHRLLSHSRLFCQQTVSNRKILFQTFNFQQRLCHLPPPPSLSYKKHLVCMYFRCFVELRIFSADIVQMQIHILQQIYSLF